jgi:autotransporter-associated beta strand protein
VVGGTIYQPSTATYTTADSGQSVLTASGTAAGMTVSREITVPSTGNDDFARTVDTFTNPTGSPITTTVQVVSTFGSTAAATVFATSDGSGVVAPGDQWIGTVDGGGPAIINYIHGPFGLQPSSVSVVGDNIQWTYNLTVPAGQTAQLAYFTILASTQAVAVASANALVTNSGFGGQAAAIPIQGETQSLANFVFQDTEIWTGSTAGNWTDSQWSNAPPAYPNSLVGAVVNTPQVVTVNSPQQALSLSVSGGGQVTIASGGSLTVGNSVNLGPNGTLSVLTGGTLAIASLAEGASPASLELSGGELQATGAFTSTVPLVIDTNSGTVDTNGFGVALAGAIGGGTGNGGLIKTGAGTLTLSGANSYQGGTVVSGGTLVVDTAAALPAGGALTIGAGGIFEFAPSLSAQVVSATNRVASADLPVSGPIIANVANLPPRQAPVASDPAALVTTATKATGIEVALPQASVRSTPDAGVDVRVASAVLSAGRNTARQAEHVTNRVTGLRHTELVPTAFLQSYSTENLVGNTQLLALIDFLAQQRHTSQRDSAAPQIDELLLKYGVPD